ncbi:gamma-glutamylcyclotransferase family protein [Henriciella marina]|uniref:Gamma-glutamylcyclotransferase n=1 Tax=Henriciella marina TaxID=453851 RepID=A0ABT4LQE5_9PROT|nr:gamma-glutamylcyclotransferase family protein [Henriciella marina]MCZ4296536.1 gamma-glutamylcyclotransferase [Henriciella marina]
MIAPPVSAGDHFVFYGLLKQGMPGGPKGVDLERHGEFLGPCRFKGAMFDMGSYPGVLRKEGICHGMLYRLDHPRIARKLDAFEGVRTDAPMKALYRREKVSILDDFGRPCAKAWAYVYNRPVAGRPMVRSGFWSAGRKSAARTA